MIPQLTEELRHALQETQDQGPVTLVDPANNRKYVLLREEVYNRIRSLCEVEDFEIRETYAAQDTAAGAAWSHPDDAAYDNYDAHRLS